MFYLSIILICLLAIAAILFSALKALKVIVPENIRVLTYTVLGLFGLIASVLLSISNHNNKAIGYALVLLNGIVFVSNGIKLMYMMRSPESVMAKSKGADAIFTKKHNSIDETRPMSTLVLLGLALIMGMVVYAFNFKNPQMQEIVYGELMLDDDIEIEPPPTDQEKKPPPPPPPPIIEEVEDEEEVEEEPEIIDIEVEEETEVEIIEETGDEEEEVEEEVEEPEIFTIVEQMPSFPGGEAALFKFLGNNIKYPPIAKENGIEGMVYVSFVVMEDGSIQGAKVVRDIGGGCGKEAMRVVNKMPNWTPGKQRGKNVRVQYNLPVRFQLR